MFGGKKKPDPRVQAILEAEGIKYEVDREGDYRILCGFEMIDRNSSLSIVILRLLPV